MPSLKEKVNSQVPHCALGEEKFGFFSQISFCGGYAHAQVHPGGMTTAGDRDGEVKLDESQNP